MAYGRAPRKNEYVDLQTGEICLLPGTATTRCEVEMDYFFGQHTGTIEVVVDVTSAHVVGTDAFEKDALQAGYNHGEAGVFIVAGCKGLRVYPVGFGVKLTDEREGDWN